MNPELKSLIENPTPETPLIGEESEYFQLPKVQFGNCSKQAIMNYMAIICILKGLEGRTVTKLQWKGTPNGVGGYRVHVTRKSKDRVADSHTQN